MEDLIKLINLAESKQESDFKDLYKEFRSSLRSLSDEALEQSKNARQKIKDFTDIVKKSSEDILLRKKELEDQAEKVERDGREYIRFSKDSDEQAQHHLIHEFTVKQIKMRQILDLLQQKHSEIWSKTSDFLNDMRLMMEEEDAKKREVQYQELLKQKEELDLEVEEHEKRQVK